MSYGRRARLRYDRREFDTCDFSGVDTGNQRDGITQVGVDGIGGMPMRRRRRREFDYFSGANPEQCEAIAHDDGPALVLAGAGSGKSFCLVRRAARLIGERKAEPSEILAVTFSRKAADSMNARLTGLGVTTARVGTWHSVCWEILRMERSQYSDWELDTRDRIRLLTKLILGHQGMKWRGADLSLVLTYVGLCKANLIDPGTEEALQFAKAMHASDPCPARTPELLVQAYLELANAQHQRQLLTFDDMLVEAHRLLSEDAGVRARWSGRWRYLIEDEFQDASRAQRAIGDMLASEHRNYMAVGDSAQMIYGFRGSSQSHMTGYVREYDPKIIKLGRNYRSGVEIVTAANRVAEEIAMSVQMSSERETTAEVVAVQYADTDKEGEAVASDAIARSEDGQRWEQMAVLYRTNAQSRGIEEAFIAARIPYVVLGGSNFYERKEVRALLSYLRVAAGDATFSDVRRSLGAPFRYLSKSFLDRFEQDSRGCRSAADWVLLARHVADQPRVAPLQRVAVLEWATLIETLAEATSRQGNPSLVGTDKARETFPAALLERVIAETKFVEYLTRDEGAETVENNRVSNIRELVRSAERFTSSVELLEYVRRVISASKEKVRGDRVTLMSIHRSKGLEYQTVYFVGANEQLIPHAKSEDLSEERRLFYVALTRARDSLVLSCVTRAAIGAGVRTMEPSRFIATAGLELRQAQA